MDTGKAINYSDVFERLRAATDILQWDHKTQNWKSIDGNWYSLSAEKLVILERTLEILTDSCRIAFEIQYLIANKTLDFVKNILLHPEPYLTENNVSQKAWQLMFNLVQNNKENQRIIWKECEQLFLNCLQQNSRHKDQCRLVLFDIYALGRLCLNECTKILKILLKNFNDETEEKESNKQGLNMFLDYFVCNDERITWLYPRLNTEEKMCLLKFTNLYLEKGSFNDVHVSKELIWQICIDLQSKNEQSFKLCITDNIALQEIMALLKVIATASQDSHYGFTYYSYKCYELIQRIGSLFKIVLTNGEVCEKAYMDVTNNSDCPLKLLLLTTISNIVKDIPINRVKARECGLIESLVDFIVAEGTDPTLYRFTVFTLIDICYENPANKQFIGELVSNRKHLKSEMLGYLMFDLTYKRKKENI